MSDQDPSVMIGVPAYNAETHLAAALESILNQTYENFQIVIADNASTDRTADICAEFEKRDSRVRVIRQKENLGGARNFNYVGRLARGKYFKWAASNDLCQPRFLECCVSALEENPDCVLAYPEAFLIGESGEVQSEYKDTLVASDTDVANRFLSALSTIELNNAQYGLIRSDVLLGTRFEGAYASGDIPFMAELALHGKFLRLPERLFMRRVSPESSTIGNDPSANRDFNKIHGSALKTNTFLNFWFHVFAIVATAQLPVTTKLRISKALARRVWWGLATISRRKSGAKKDRADRGLSPDKALGS